MIRSCALVFSVIAFNSATMNADDGPHKDVPQLKALASYVGTWDVAISAGNLPYTQGESTAEWILDGRFVQQTGHLKASDGSVLKIRTLMTWDQQASEYRMWSFLSNGTVSESSGKWDAGSRTMTSVRSEGGFTTTTTAKFPEPGVEEWTIVTKNQTNEVVAEISGRNSRRKP